MDWILAIHSVGYFFQTPVDIRPDPHVYRHNGTDGREQIDRARTESRVSWTNAVDAICLSLGSGKALVGSSGISLAIEHMAPDGNRIRHYRFCRTSAPRA